MRAGQVVRAPMAEPRVKTGSMPVMAGTVVLAEPAAAVVKRAAPAVLAG
ncbi:hypothetical protein NJB1907E90_20720 [Mycobacterium marinum]|nr:hypothetical protein NJB1907E90_20720 [Mycobacterium marinum]